MASRILPAALACAIGFACTPARAGAQPGALDDAMRAFFAASTERDAGKASARILATGATFEDVRARLERGRTYEPTVGRGDVLWQAYGPGGLPLPTTVHVPRDYDPARRYPLRVYLHGGVARPMPDEGRGAPRRRLESAEPAITVYPTGAAEATWWSTVQIDQIDKLLARLKRAYNIDENRIHLMGVSDGGTGAYYFGLKHATPWSAIFPFNGHLRVLANAATRVDGELHLTNLVNMPAYVINGGLDPLYPVSAVQPYLQALARAGAPVEFHPQMDAAHSTPWWPAQQGPVDAFERTHPRVPLPDALSWTTDRTDRFNRFRWLVIDVLDATASSADLADHNAIELVPTYDFGMRIDSRVDAGRRVVDVVAKTDAAAMGLKRHDLIVEMDGRPIRGADDIGRAFDAHRQRSPLAFTVERGRERLSLQVDFPPTLAPVTAPVFEHRKPSGRVDLVRRGNEVEARTAGVGAFTLLLSPAQFDFTRPIVVTVNGRRALERTVEPDIATMLAWAARDQDRTMLFGAAVQIQVPR